MYTFFFDYVILNTNAYFLVFRGIGVGDGNTSHSNSLVLPWVSLRNYVVLHYYITELTFFFDEGKMSSY